MAERTCYLCGQPAKGYASVYTKATGERWYCHGDEDEEQTCYMKGQSSLSTAEQLYGIDPDYLSGLSVDEHMEQERQR